MATATPTKEEEKEAALTLTEEFVAGTTGLKDNIFYDKIMAGLTIEVLLKSGWPMHTEMGYFTMSQIIRRGNFPRERYNRGCKVKWLECVYDILTKPAYEYFTREGKNWAYTEKGLKEVALLQAAPDANVEEAEQVVTTIIPSTAGQASSFIVEHNTTTPTQPKKKKKSRNSQSEEERMFGYIEKYLKMKGIVLPQAAPESQPSLHPTNSTDETTQQSTYYQPNSTTMTTASDTLLTSPPVPISHSSQHSSRSLDIDSPKYMCVEALGLLEGSDSTWRIQSAPQGQQFLISTSELMKRDDRESILSAIKEYEGVKRKHPQDESYSNKTPKRD